MAGIRRFDEFASIIYSIKMKFGTRVQHQNIYIQLKFGFDQSNILGVMLK